MSNRNYQRELEQLLSEDGEKKRLLLHVCCAPCSSYTLEYLSKYFDTTVFFYNPNITEITEYQKRLEEEKRFLEEFPFEVMPSFIEGKYEPEKFNEIAEGREAEHEGGVSCFSCYELRLMETARIAADKQFDYFCTTLSISPHKNADKLMEIGEYLAEQFGVAYLPSDFKKKNGYQRSIQLSKEYELYRQDYCGCRFSKNGRETGRS